MPLDRATEVGRAGGWQIRVCVPTALGERGRSAVLELNHETHAVVLVASDLVEWVVRLARRRWEAQRGETATWKARLGSPRVEGLWAARH